MNFSLRLHLLFFFLLLGWSAIAQSCDTPELLTASMITDSSVVLTWTDVGNAYEMELREDGQAFTGIPTHTINVDPPFLLTDLVPGQLYRFQLRTVCSPGNFSPWSARRPFTTDLNNRRPCPLLLSLRDTSCNNPQLFKVHVDNAPGLALGADVQLHIIRIAVEHPWRSDLGIWLQAPDGTRRKLIGGLNAGDQNIGEPMGSPAPFL
ncbi:MAG: fibronectin type III domain-containing protein [Lewinellaceae bacterium]|nr:fibronectin type III domain-containing protein [Lewinellaceae bacterium]